MRHSAPLTTNLHTPTPTERGNVWRALAALPHYAARLTGRVLPDLINEASRYGCQYDRPCAYANGTRACAAGVDLYRAAMAAVRAHDAGAPVAFNGMGQDAGSALPGLGKCGGQIPGWV